MALSKEKQQARELRKNGESIGKIATALAVSKSSVSYWCRDIELTQKQIEALIESGRDARLRGQLIGAEMNKNKKRQAIANAEVFGKNFVKTLNKRELGLIVAALYWSEGAKSGRTCGFQFINSDPSMILIVKNFLIDVLGVPKEDLRCGVQINEQHTYRINDVLNYWRNLLQLSSEQMKNPYFIRTKLAKIYENHDTYFGVCRLMVCKSTMLKYKMIGLINALKSDIVLPR